MNPSGWRHRFFQLGVILKGLDGLLEITSGTLLIVFGSEGLGRAVRFLTRFELSEDPRDVVAGWALRHAEAVGADTVRFASLYLLAHGVVKVVLAIGLIRERLGVFPAALAIMGLFTLYQAYRLTVLPSVGLGALTALDLVIIALVWTEYRLLRRGGRAAVSDAHARPR